MFSILGGGIGGLSLAIALQRKDINVTVYEAAPAWKPLGAGLGLAGNAVKAFREIGIEEDVLREGKVLKHVVIRNSRGKTLMATDSQEISRRFGVVNNFAIHRADLHHVLSSLLRPGTVQLGKSCTDLQQDSDGVTLHFSDGTSMRTDYVIAADGIHSAVRKKLMPDAKPRYAGYTCWRGVTDNLPDGFDADETSESWGLGSRFGIVPLTRGRVYWFAWVNASPNDTMMRSLSPMDLLAFFGDFARPVPQLLERTPKEAIIWNDIIDIEPVSRFAFDRVVLMGDAAHATTPNMGQGACMAIEDAATLGNLLQNTTDAEAAFRTFQEKRIQRTTRIVKDSWRIGKLAQSDNPLLATIRNMALSLAPARLTENQFKFIYDVSFK